MGYHDEETVAMSNKFASGMCFGGKISWSVDFQSGGGMSVSLTICCAVAPHTDP